MAELLELAAARSGAGAKGLRKADLEQLGRFCCDGHALDVLGVRVALKQLSGTDPGATSSVRKLLGMQYAQRIADFCWAMLGPDGALGAGRPGVRDGPGAAADLAWPTTGSYWSRQVLFTRALTIGGGTTDIQLNIIGERLLGLPRDPEPGT